MQGSVDVPLPCASPTPLAPPSPRQRRARCRVAYSPQCGRYVVADEPIKAGDILFEEQQMAMVLFDTHLERFCSYCAGAIPKGKGVACICKLVHYCCERCAELDHEIHSVECRAFRGPHAQLLLDNADGRCLLRVLTYWKFEHAERLAQAASGSALAAAAPPPPPSPKVGEDAPLQISLEPYVGVSRTVPPLELLPTSRNAEGRREAPRKRYRLSDALSLVDNLEAFSAEDLAGKRRVGAAVLGCFEPGELPDDLDEIRHWVPPECKTLEDLAVRVQCIIDCNTFTVYPLLGFSIHPSASMVNHTCSPNAYFCFHRSSTLRIVALTDIQPATEVTINYMPLKWSTMRRRAYARHAYCFDCCCARCRKAPHSNEGELTALLCAICAGTMHWNGQSADPEWACSGCGQRCTGEAARRIFALLNEVWDEITEIDAAPDPCTPEQAATMFDQVLALRRRLYPLLPDAPTDIFPLLHPFHEVVAYVNVVLARMVDLFIGFLPQPPELDMPTVPATAPIRNAGHSIAVLQQLIAQTYRFYPVNHPQRVYDALTAGRALLFYADSGAFVPPSMHVPPAAELRSRARELLERALGESERMEGEDGDRTQLIHDLLARCQPAPGSAASAAPSPLGAAHAPVRSAGADEHMAAGVGANACAGPSA